MKRVMNLLPVRTLALLVIITFTTRGVAQEIKFSVHADPLITWIGSNASDYNNMGAKAGFNAGLNILYYFADNYAASSGVSILVAGGRQSAVEDHTMVFNNLTPKVNAGDEMIYNLSYLNIPLGIRLQTNQVGYLTYFTDMGFDIRMLLKSTVDLPVSSEGPITDENAKNEVHGMNAGWHFTFGVEYELGIETSIIAGLGYDQDFFDVTKDLQNQPEDRSGLRMVRFRLGVKF
jgi:hypothetical protein